MLTPPFSETEPGDALMMTSGMPGSSIITVAVDGVPMRTPRGGVPKPIFTPSPTSSRLSAWGKIRRNAVVVRFEPHIGRGTMEVDAVLGAAHHFPRQRHLQPP